MSVDVEIYMNNIIKFFKDNPKELLNLIPVDKEDEFYDKVRQVANLNYEKGSDCTLTKMQMINICRDLNQEKKSHKIPIGLLYTKYGLVSLN